MYNFFEHKLFILAFLILSRLGGWVDGWFRGWLGWWVVEGHSQIKDHPNPHKARVWTEFIRSL